MIEYAVNKAFQKKLQTGWEKWPKMFWCVDLHDVIIEGKFSKMNEGRCLYPVGEDVLQWLTKREDMCIILWTASHQEPADDILTWLYKDYGINFDYVNENPDCPSTDLCCFDYKFYFDMLLEDKAGFNGVTDWAKIKTALIALGEWDKPYSHKG